MSNDTVPNPKKRFVVYTLARPDGRVFYIGKGSISRPQVHLNEARNLDCICRKCRIIRHIWAARKEVVITFVFETNSEREAFQREAELIREIAEKEHLCNKQMNRNHGGLPIDPRPITAQDYTAILKQRGVPAERRKMIVSEWAMGQIEALGGKATFERRKGRYDRADGLEDHADEIAMAIGMVSQLKLW